MTAPYMRLPEDEREEAEYSLAGARESLADLTSVLADHDNDEEPELQRMAQMASEAALALDRFEVAFYIEPSSDA